jgi:hypothetical protein
LWQAVAAGILINVESFRELPNIRDPRRWWVRRASPCA